MKISSCQAKHLDAAGHSLRSLRIVVAFLVLVMVGGITVCLVALSQRRPHAIAATSEQDKVLDYGADDNLTPMPSSPPIASLRLVSSIPSTEPRRQSSSEQPSDEPSEQPILAPSELPTIVPSDMPSLQPSLVSFFPGKLVLDENRLLLSEGLRSRIIASSGAPVEYSNGTSSADLFHPLPDFGATFSDPNNHGGWIYVSNSEVRNFTLHPQRGGVGAITFDARGDVAEYRMILSGTTANCGGGTTPWGAWISCEEHDAGKLWQVDPTGKRPPTVLTLGRDGGAFESFAYDITRSHYFVTEDAPGGPLRRFTPSTNRTGDPWDILLGPGETHFLLLHPSDSGDRGYFDWTTDRTTAKENSRENYQHSEGIDVSGRELRFVSKNWKSMFVLDLDQGTYYNTSTVSGLLDGAPDQLQRITGHDDLLFFTEEGGTYPGVHAMNKAGEMMTILESSVHLNDETTGLAFSPDGRHLYFAFQDTGILYEITREDGLPFDGRTMNVRYSYQATDEL